MVNNYCLHINWCYWLFCQRVLAKAQSFYISIAHIDWTNLDITANSAQNLTFRSIVESFDRQRTISFCKSAASEATSNSLASSSEIRLDTRSVSALAPADLADADVRSVSISRRAESRCQWFKTFFPFVTDAITIKASLTSFFSLV